MTDHKTLFLLLEGDWQFSREIHGSYEAKLEGTASFQHEEGDDEKRKYLYTENAQVQMADGSEYASKQSYIYQLKDDGIDVFKQEEGKWKLMHQLQFSSSEKTCVASHVHQCGQDQYAATYSIKSEDEFELSYQIKGPKKDYSIVSVYSR